MLESNLYYYPISEAKAVDGDTLTAVVDLGFNTFKKARIRLSRVDAVELRDEQGKEAREYVQRRLDESKEKIIHSRSLDKYGRSLAEVYLDGKNLNDELLASQFIKKK